jgi:hypothetical protein
MIPADSRQLGRWEERVSAAMIRSGQRFTLALVFHDAA